MDAVEAGMLKRDNLRMRRALARCWHVASGTGDTPAGDIASLAVQAVEDLAQRERELLREGV